MLTTIGVIVVNRRCSSCDVWRLPLGAVGAGEAGRRGGQTAVSQSPRWVGATGREYQSTAPSETSTCFV